MFRRCNHCGTLHYAEWPLMNKRNDICIMCDVFLNPFDYDEGAMELHCATFVPAPDPVAEFAKRLCLMDRC